MFWSAEILIFGLIAYAFVHHGEHSEVWFNYDYVYSGVGNLANNNSVKRIQCQNKPTQSYADTEVGHNEIWPVNRPTMVENY